MPSKKQQPGSGLGAVVLCGGKSSRLGVDKTQLVFGGQTFLERVVEQVSQVCAPVAVVGRTSFEHHNLTNVLIDQDDDETKGPLEGIRVGLKRLSDTVDFAFVTSCDVPLLRPELVQHLWAMLGDRQAVVPMGGERVFGMTAIYRTDLHLPIEGRVANNELRVSDLASAFNTRRVDLNELKLVDPDLDSFTNINSPKDYFALLERFGQDCPEALMSRLRK